MMIRSLRVFEVFHVCVAAPSLLWISACGDGRDGGPAVPEFVTPGELPSNVPTVAPTAASGDETPSGADPEFSSSPGNARDELPEGVPAPVLDPGSPAGEGSGPASSDTPASTPAAGSTPASGDTPVGIHGQLRVEGTHLVDEAGMPIQLRGVSTMWLNWEPRYSINRQGLEWMRDNWNVTVLRAAMGIEPDGAYLTDPEASLAQLRTVVQNAIDVGVYVVIDWHDHNAHLHREQAENFFSRVATEFGGVPNVLYEPYNEPLDVSWSGVIKPYHEAVLRAIRAQDEDNVVILGTRSWSQRVDEAAGDRVEGANLMYTVHFYACDHRDFQRREAQVAYDAGLPLFVTEWGATAADGGARSPTVCSDDAQVWLDWLGERGISWAAWKLDGCRDASCFFTSREAPANGGWTDEWLHGHAHFVIDRLLE